MSKSETTDADVQVIRNALEAGLSHEPLCPAVIEHDSPDAFGSLFEINEALCTCRCKAADEALGRIEERLANGP